MIELLNEIQLLLTTKITLKAILGVVLTVFGFFFDLLLAKVFLILLVLTLIDCILGYIRAIVDRRVVASRLMRKYAWKFVGYVIASSALYMVGQGSPNLPYITVVTGLFDDLALAFFIVQEATSIIENLNELGVPMPQGVFKNLRKIKEGFNDEDYKKIIN